MACGSQTRLTLSLTVIGGIKTKKSWSVVALPATMSARDSLMQGRLRAARDKEEVTPGAAGSIELRPTTLRGRNTDGLSAHNLARQSAASFGSLVEIRQSTPIITPLAEAVQTNVRKVLTFFLPDSVVVS